MIKLKKLIEVKRGSRGFEPIIGPESVGKYLVVYVIDKTVVKGTRAYDTSEEANKMATFINKNMDDINLAVKVVKIVN